MDKYIIKSASTESLSSKRPADEDLEWQKPKRPATPRAFSLRPPSLHVSNRFSTLRADQQSDQPSQASQDATKKTPRTGQIPPIIIDIQQDWTHEIIKNMILEFTKNYHLKYRGKNKVAIYCHDSASHQALKVGLRSKASFHTFSRKDERTPKLVVHGLPSSEEQSLADEIKNLGFNDVKISKMKTKNPDSTFSPFLVQLSTGADVPKFKQIKYLCSCVVDIQRFKPNNTMGTQCYRCQRFGHSAKNCNLMERCVKCVEEHATKDCPKKTRDIPARCCNCNEDHPANYRQCSVRQKYIQQISAKQNTKTAMISKIIRDTNPNESTWAKPSTSRNVTPINLGSRSQFPPLFLNNNVNRNVKPPILNANFGETEINKHADEATAEILQILSAVKSIKKEFQACSSMVDKVILVLTHLGQYV